MDQAIRAAIRRDIGGDHQRIDHVDTEIWDVTFKHILLPVWVSAYRYGGKSYRFVVNGQSGKVMGERPYSATIILGGQIKGAPSRLFLIYPEGNFIEASDDTPFFQIGETKYGRPILVRAFDPEMSFEDAVKLLMVSFDSTIKANLSVNLPLDLHVYTADSLKHRTMTRIEKMIRIPT